MCPEYMFSNLLKNSSHFNYHSKIITEKELLSLDELKLFCDSSLKKSFWFEKSFTNHFLHSMDMHVGLVRKYQPKYRKKHTIKYAKEFWSSKYNLNVKRENKWVLISEECYLRFLSAKTVFSSIIFKKQMYGHS